MSKVLIGFLLGAVVVLALLNVDWGGVTVTDLPPDGAAATPAVAMPAPLPTAAAPVVITPAATATVDPAAAQELAAVEAALANSQRVAGVCIEEAAKALRTGAAQPNCEPVFQQVQRLEMRRIELEAGR